MTQFMSDNKLLDTFQSGFRSGHSTTTALLNVTDELNLAIDRGLVSLLVLLDFSKAFDSVNYQVLLSKLSKFNFSASAISWFRSYLFDRQQCVSLESKTSNFCAQVSGVPQGSVLGPLLFSLYLQDLSDCLSFSSYHLYADDLQIYLSSKVSDWPTAVHHINHDLTMIESWASDNFLNLNPDKCQCLVIGMPKSVARVLNMNADHLSVQLSSKSIPYERESVRNLGVLFDSSLSWHHHTTFICNKIYSCLHPLKRLKYILPQSIKAKLVESLISPVADYCDVLYDGFTQLLSNKLQRSFNHCIRFIFNKKSREQITPMLKQLSWLRLTDRRSLHSLTLLHKLIYSSDTLPGYLSSRVTLLQSERNGPLLLIPRCQTAACSNHFFTRAPREWNQLPKEIRSTTSNKKFKQLVHEHFLLSPP